MIVTLELRPEIEERVTALAAHHGVSVEEYIQNFLESIAPLDEELSTDSMTPEEWTKEFEEWMDSHDYITATAKEEIPSYELSGGYQRSVASCAENQPGFEADLAQGLNQHFTRSCDRRWRWAERGKLRSYSNDAMRRSRFD